jgi:hypothetical protein
MKQQGFILMFFMLSIIAVTAQSKVGGGVYGNIGIAHNYKFQLDKILKDMGRDKISPFASSVSIGTHVDYRNVVYSLDLGIENMYTTKTPSTNLLVNLSVGYQLFLPKENSLIFSGNLCYELYNVHSYLTKGSWNMQNGALIPTEFSVQLHQFMIGAKFSWRSDYLTLGIGYDVGCIPTTWQSGSVEISNSPKERIDRVHFDITYDIRKF